LAAIKLVERAPMERGNPLLYGAAGLVAGIVIAVAIGALTPAGISGTLHAFVKVFSSPSFLALSLPYFTAISLSGVGLALAYRASFITIGAEGQLILGMITGFWLLYYMLPGLGRISLLVGSAISVLVGSVYGLLVGLLRVYLGVNETLVSLMLNYIALSVLNYLVSGPWSVGGFTKTDVLPAGVVVSSLTASLVALIVLVALEVLYRYTRLGVAIDSIGLARKMAMTYGINYARVILKVSFLSGGVAGLAGFLYLVSGAQRLYSTSYGPGYGYIGILAAWLAGLRPLGVIASSMLLGLLYVMNTSLQLSGVLPSFVQAMQAVIVLSVTAFVALSRYRIVVS